MDPHPVIVTIYEKTRTVVRSSYIPIMSLLPGGVPLRDTPGITRNQNLSARSHKKMFSVFGRSHMLNHSPGHPVIPACWLQISPNTPTLYIPTKRNATFVRSLNPRLSMRSCCIRLSSPETLTLQVLRSGKLAVSQN